MSETLTFIPIAEDLIVWPGTIRPTGMNTADPVGSAA
jgi:hypothetical protein